MGKKSNEYSFKLTTDHCLLVIMFISVTIACSDNRFTQQTSIVQPTLQPSPYGSPTPSPTAIPSPTLSPQPTITPSPTPTFEPTSFCLSEPGNLNSACFSSIDQPYFQTEFNSAINDADTRNFNYRNFTYEGNDVCSVTQIEYSYDVSVENPASYADLFPALTTIRTMDQTNASCKHAKISALIKLQNPNGACTPSTVPLSNSEFTDLNTMKITTPKSGGDIAGILLEATFLQSNDANILSPAISINSNCRCYYTFSDAYENTIKVMALQEHCKAHFVDWDF